MTWSYTNPPQKDKRIREVIRGEDMSNLLFDLLQTPSPHGLEDHIYNLLPSKKQGYRDAKGNFIVKIGENPKTMFSCHMDTVHTCDPELIKRNAKLKLWLLTMNDKASEKDAGMVWAGIKLDPRKHNNKIIYEPMVLGADDKVGCYILSEMIDHEIPGLYIFHVGEEQHGVGSKWIVDNTPELVKGIERAIAFDRAGYTDVIAHQSAGRTASKECTDAIATTLNQKMNLPSSKWKGDVTGVFTDTAHYKDLIPECTNLSVGYHSQHTPSEDLDVWWVDTMFLPAVLDINWDQFEAKRDPKKAETTTYYGYQRNNTWSAEKVTPSQVTRATPHQKIPEWKPEAGLLLEATHEGMLIIAEKYFQMTTGFMVARWAIPYMEEFELQKLELEDVRDKYDRLIASVKKLIESKVVQEEDVKALSIDIPENKPEVEVLPPEKKVINLPAIPDNVISIRSNEVSQVSTIPDKLDAGGFPAEQDEYKRRVALKMAIVGSFIKHEHLLRLGKKEEVEFFRLRNKFNGIVKQVSSPGNREGLKVGRKVYRILGEILCSIIDMIDENVENTTISAYVLNSYQEGQKYITNYFYEPGITIKTRA